MILVRTVLQGKFGSGGTLAASFSKTAGAMMTESGAKGRWRVLTDLSGQFDNLVLEVEVESLAEWEKLRVKQFEVAAFRDSMTTIRELVVSGRNELWTIEAEG